MQAERQVLLGPPERHVKLYKALLYEEQAAVIIPQHPAAVFLTSHT
jgi:hypothetical protein